MELPASVCHQCKETRQDLLAYDPHDAMSDLKYYCTQCWKASCGAVPGKTLMGMPDVDDFAGWLEPWWNTGDEKPLAKVFVTDFGFPTPRMLVHQTFSGLSSVLVSHGATVVNNVDAASSRTTILTALGLPMDTQVGLVVWGSPHPNTFCDIIPQDTLQAHASGNRAYKEEAVSMLANTWPEADVYMPAPKYYGFANAKKLRVPSWHGLQYYPMASSQSSYQRLCDEEHTVVLAHEKYENPEELEVNLAKKVKAALGRDEHVLFFGEYICTLSFSCCMPAAVAGTFPY